MRALTVIAALCLLLPLASCSDDPPGAPAVPGESASVDGELAAAQLVALAGWPALDEAGNPVATAGDKAQGGIVWLERHELTPDVAYYEARLQTGPGEHDAISLHRVVRESRPGVPIRTKPAIMLLHGDISTFEICFLPGYSSPRQPDDWGFAVHLAEAGIDVWGIGQAWTLVPADETDFAFMDTWGLQRQVDDLGTAIAVARAVRRQTGNGLRPLNLLGYSSGSATCFAYLAQESQLPPGHRQVSGYVSGDYGLLSDFAPWQEAMVGDIALYQTQLDAHQPFPNPFPLFAPPALSDPDGPSAIFPGYTNLQAAIALGAMPAYYYVEGMTYHFVAGTFVDDDVYGVPLGLQYFPVDNWLDFMVAAPPYEAPLFMQDYSRVALDPGSTTWDDHLSDVRVPVLWLEATGGAGAMARRTLDVIASTDVTEVVVSYHPPEEILLDFAHIDIFLSPDAVPAIWDPARDWILAHAPR